MGECDLGDDAEREIAQVGPGQVPRPGGVVADLLPEEGVGLGLAPEGVAPGVAEEEGLVEAGADEGWEVVCVVCVGVAVWDVE